MPVKIDKEQIKKDVDATWEMKEDEIYQLLGLAQMGTKSMTEATDSLKLLMSAAANPIAAKATASISTTLEKKGKTFFKEAWETIRELVCYIYTEKISTGDKDIVAYLVGAIVAAAKLSHPIAVLVITAAVKFGLNKLCKVYKLK